MAISWVDRIELDCRGWLLEGKLAVHVHVVGATGSAGPGRVWAVIRLRRDRTQGTCNVAIDGVCQYVVEQSSCVLRYAPRARARACYLQHRHSSGLVLIGETHLQRLTLHSADGSRLAESC